MGRRARARAQAAADGRPIPAPAAPSPRRLDPVRRTLAAYLVAALVLAILTLAGIIVLGGTLGPFVTLAVIVVAAALVHRAVAPRLAGAVLRDEDRMMQTLAGGLLALSVALAAAGALVSTLA